MADVGAGFVSSREAVERFCDGATFGAQRAGITALVDCAAGGVLKALASSARQMKVRLGASELVATMTDFEVPQELWEGASRYFSPSDIRSLVAGNVDLDSGGFKWRLSGVRFYSHGFDLAAPATQVATREPESSSRMTDDDILVMLMRNRIQSQYYASPHAASKDLAIVAGGSTTTEESRAKRLERLYKKTFPD